MIPAIRKFSRSVNSVLLGCATIVLMWGPVAAAADPNPYARPDDSWITISGKVQSVRRDAFVLDYGDGDVLVEMDDGDRDADAYSLLEGDSVTVVGTIDDDFYELTKIEASSVYVENIGSTFFASAVDEEVAESWAVAATVPIEESETIVWGTVTDVDKQEFTVDLGIRELRVEVDQMPYNPLDDEGYQKIRVGDRVKVTGRIDSNFFEGRELEADTIVKLSS